jgi:hypothetical protein
MNLIAFPTWGSQVATMAEIKCVVSTESGRSKSVPIGNGKMVST